VFTEVEADAAVQASGDGVQAPVPVVIGRSLAESLWPEGDPVGRSIVWSQPGGTLMTVVGVVGDIRDLTFPMDPEPAVYLPHRLVAWPTMSLVIRAQGDPALVARQAREAIWSVDGTLPVPEMQLLDEILGAALAGPRLNLILMGVFSLSALLLAAVGLYGLTAFSVARQTREIGVRLALGAPGSGVLRLILRKGLKLALAGTMLGLVGALILTRFMENLLFGVRPMNAPTYLAAALVLGSVTVVAALIPARRALKVDPASSLQAE
jgi:ABC-type antimicrobial peptide transport system permease subunit